MLSEYLRKRQQPKDPKVFVYSGPEMYETNLQRLFAACRRDYFQHTILDYFNTPVTLQKAITPTASRQRQNTIDTIIIGSTFSICHPLQSLAAVT